jgi:hypothetical protein
MAQLGTLGTRCRGVCPISLQETSRGGDKVIRMSDNQCYYTSYISRYIKLLLRNYNLGHPNFVLPTRSPITQRDLDSLYITPGDIVIIKQTWRRSPEYLALRAEREELDRQMAAEMAEESEPESEAGSEHESEAESVESTIGSAVSEISHEREVNTVVRWGVQLSHSEEELIHPDIIQRIDRFLLPPGQAPNEEDDSIEERRKRPLGYYEYDFLHQGVMPPAGTRLGIRVSGEVFDSLEAYVEYMNQNGHPEITLASVQGTPITGGRKRKTNRKRGKKTRMKRKTNRKRVTRRTR